MGGVLLAQTMPVCGSWRGGEVVTPQSVPYGLGCSAPVGDGGGGYVRLKPGWDGGIRVGPDLFEVPGRGEGGQ